MRSAVDPHVVGAVRFAALPLAEDDDHGALLDLIGDAHFVLLGEASHGTHEFYRERARITRRLIAQKGFNAVAIEGDWPDAHRVNRFVRPRRRPVCHRRAGGLQAFSDLDAEPLFFARLPEQFDALVHIDVTRAVEPLERNAMWNGAELPETYPAGV